MSLLANGSSCDVSWDDGEEDILVLKGMGFNDVIESFRLTSDVFSSSRRDTSEISSSESLLLL